MHKHLSDRGAADILIATEMQRRLLTMQIPCIRVCEKDAYACVLVQDKLI